VHPEGRHLLLGRSRRVSPLCAGKSANTTVSLFETSHARESAWKKRKNEDAPLPTTAGAGSTTGGDDGGGESRPTRGTGPGSYRKTQTMFAFFTVPVARLGPATRPRVQKERWEGTDPGIFIERPCQPKKGSCCDETPLMLRQAQP